MFRGNIITIDSDAIVLTRQIDLSQRGLFLTYVKIVTEVHSLRDRIIGRFTSHATVEIRRIPYSFNYSL